MNKYEKTLKRYCAFERTTDEQETVEEQKRYDLLQELVERATPNKVLDLKPLQNLKGCPNCNSIISPLEYFCKKCGQALDWSE